MAQYNRPTADKGLRNKVARRKVRNHFLKFAGSTRVFRSILSLFKGSVVAWIVMVLMAGFVIFATGSSYFDVKKITIERDDVFLDTEKVKNALDDFYGRNLIFLPKDELITHLKDQFPDFRDVSVTDKWPNEIQLKITLSPPVFNVFNAETANFSVLSSDGVILETNVNEALPVLRIFQHENLLVPREKFMKKVDIDNILLASEIARSELKLDVQDLHYLSDALEVHLIGPNEAAIWLDLRVDIKAQLRKLDLAAEKIGLYKNDFEHIDLRVPNQLFWKEK